MFVIQKCVWMCLRSVCVCVCGGGGGGGNYGTNAPQLLLNCKKIQACQLAHMPNTLVYNIILLTHQTHKEDGHWKREQKAGQDTQ